MPAKLAGSAGIHFLDILPQLIATESAQLRCNADE
jgi:hypothetical protein